MKPILEYDGDNFKLQDQHQPMGPLENSQIYKSNEKIFGVLKHTRIVVPDVS